MKNNVACITITYQQLRRLAFSFLLLPVLLFILFFVKWFIAIPAAAILIWAFTRAIREETDETQSFDIPKQRLLVFGVVCALWCFLGGQGGLFYQTSDWNERNAILRDLITQNWPVYYPETDTMLTYYIGHWMPAAVVGRVFYLITGGNVSFAFTIGSLVLGLWTLIGVLTTLMLHICTVRPKHSKGQWLVFWLFLGFSGMDILGCLLKGWSLPLLLQVQHLEWWSGGYQFSSNTTCLFWVFNQAIPAWIATLCFVNEKNNRSYAFIIGCALLSASLPCVGLAILMLGKVAWDVIGAVKSGTVKEYIRRTFSFVNVGSTAVLVPIIGSYLLSNSALENTAAGENAPPAAELTVPMIVIVAGLALLAVAAIFFRAYSANTLRRKDFSKFSAGSAILLIMMVLMICLHPETRRIYFVFLFLECGLYWFLLAGDFWDDLYFYLIGATLVICPLIKVGISADFCMRASLPALTILTTMCGKKLCAWQTVGKNARDRRNKFNWRYITCTLLIACLIIGAATPVMEILRGFINVVMEGSLGLSADSIYTLNQYHSSGGIYGNFVSESYRSSLFFRFFAS